MSCQFLMGRQVKMCGAFNCTLILSLDELNSKCTVANHTNCRIYQKRIAKGAKLPLKDYAQDYVLPSV